MKFFQHTQSLYYMGELDMLHTPLLLNLYDGFLLFHQLITVNGLMYSEKYVTLPKACYLHASEVLKQEWQNSSAAFKERRIKYERELAEYLLHYEPVQLLDCETVSGESEVVS